jgi:leucyl/phenylalanyl-tRNA--protein transferase
MIGALDLLAAPAAEPVAYGGRLTAADLLTAYRAGVFPMPADGPGGALINRTLHEQDVACGRIAELPGRADPYDLAWHCPDPMPVLDVGGVRFGRNTRRLVRNRYAGWRTTADQCFAEVLAGCARDRRPQWITEELAAGLLDLHRAGWAHSVEVWDGDTLIAGLFGVAVGRVFSADSMFHTVPDASKVALADLAERLRPTPARMIAVQVPTPHVIAAGATTVSRQQFLATVAESGDPILIDPSPQFVARLAPAAGGGDGKEHR